MTRNRHAFGLAPPFIIAAMFAVGACSPASEEASSDVVDEEAVAAIPVTAENAQHGEDIGTLPLPQRLAFMSGHVEAGLALYRAGEPEMAAPHLLHPVSETHAAEREGLADLGFQPELFETVSTALEQGRPAADIEDQLAAAEDNLRMVTAAAGGDASAIIRFLMDTLVEEYEIAITDGAVSDPGEYQDAYGFAVVAHDRAEALPEGPRTRTRAALDQLIALFPEGGPIPPDTPASVAEVTDRAARVQLALPLTPPPQ